MHEVVERGKDELDLKLDVPPSASAAPVRRSAMVIGKADDPYEREADRVATEVQQRLSQGSTARRSGGGGADPLGGQAVTPEIEQQIRSSSGRPLDAPVRAPLEQAFGADFGGVRIHDSSSADKLSRSLQAEAFTVGNDIFFQTRNFAPHTPQGEHLLAHELAHVVQEPAGASRSMAPVRRFMDLELFKKMTAEGTFTGKSSAQDHIETLILEYHALKGGGEVDGKKKAKDSGIIPDSKLDQAIALVTDMKLSAESWMKGHTTSDGVKDPKRVKRMAGMEWFVLQANERLITLNRFKETAKSVTQEPVEVNPATGKLTERYEGSTTSMLERVAFVLDQAVPEDGNECEFTLEFSIPCDPSGMGTIGGRMLLSAENDDGSITARAEIAITGGIDVGFGDIKAGLGGYIEASASTSQGVMKLVSYAMYRKLMESNVPREVSSFLWGGDAGEYGRKKADEWSLNVEKEMWGEGAEEGAYVETGALGEIGASIGIGDVASVDLGAQYTDGLRYDKQSLDARKGGAGEKNNKSSGWFTQNVASKFGAKGSERGAEKRLGRTVRNLTLSASAEAGPFSGELSLALAFESTGNHKEMNITPLRSVEVGLSLKATLPGSEVDGGFGGYAGDLAAGIIESLGNASSKGQKDVANSDPGAAGAVAGATGAIQAGVGELASVSAEDMTPKEDVIPIGGFPGSVGVSAGFSFKYELPEKAAFLPTTPAKKTFSFNLNYVKELSIEVPKALEISLSKTKRLLALEKVNAGPWARK